MKLSKKFSRWTVLASLAAACAGALAAASSDDGLAPAQASKPKLGFSTHTSGLLASVAEASAPAPAAAIEANTVQRLNFLLSFISFALVNQSATRL